MFCTFMQEVTLVGPLANPAVCSLQGKHRDAFWSQPCPSTPRLCRVRDLFLRHGQHLSAASRHQARHGHRGRHARAEPNRDADRHLDRADAGGAIAGAGRLPPRAARPGAAHCDRLRARRARAGAACAVPDAASGRLDDRQRRDRPQCRGRQDRVPARTPDHEPGCTRSGASASSAPGCSAGRWRISDCRRNSTSPSSCRWWACR